MASDYTTKSIVGGNFSLWLGLLGGPILWLVQFQLNYMLVPWTCTTGKHWALHVTFIAFLALAAGIGIFARHNRRAIEKDPGWNPTTPGHGRSWFMARLGVWMSGLFVLAIAAQGAATLVLNPCQS